MDILAFEYPWISMDIQAKMTWIWIWIWMGFFSSTASLVHSPPSIPMAPLLIVVIHPVVSAVQGVTKVLSGTID